MWEKDGLAAAQLTVAHERDRQKQIDALFMAELEGHAQPAPSPEADAFDFDQLESLLGEKRLKLINDYASAVRESVKDVPEGVLRRRQAQLGDLTKQLREHGEEALQQADSLARSREDLTSLLEAMKKRGKSRLLAPDQLEDLQKRWKETVIRIRKVEREEQKMWESGAHPDRFMIDKGHLVGEAKALREFLQEIEQDTAQQNGQAAPSAEAESLQIGKAYALGA